jgi:3-isopropylmalate dehydrogenase
MSETRRVAIVAGDGIGVDVTREVLQALDHLRSRGLPLEWREFDYSADTYLKTGVAMPPGGMQELAAFDAIFMGAFGDPRVPDMAHARAVLLGARFELDLYVNQRPTRLYHPSLTPLKGVERLEFTIFRENTEGLYAGCGGIFKKDTADEVATQEDINTRKGVERICRHAFEHAKKYGLRKVLMADKSNVLRFAGDLWQRVFFSLAKEYPGIEASHMFVDALCMQLVKRPQDFEVIVTNNMFGDILTDLAAGLVGGLGVAPSGNVNPETGRGMFEPVHGSAPKYAGQDVANPCGALLSAALMLEWIGFGSAGRALEAAVADSIAAGETTRDLGGQLGTRAAGAAVLKRLEAAQFQD